MRRSCWHLHASLRVVIASAVVISALAIHPTPALAIDDRLNVLTSTFTVRLGERLIINVSTPPTPEAVEALTDPQATAVVSVSAPLAVRQDVAVVAAGGDFAPDTTSSLRGPVFRATVLGGREAFQVALPTSANRNAGVVQISREGLRAVRLTLTSSTGRIAQFTTFVNVVSGRSMSELPVTFVAALDGPPTLQPDGTIAITETQREQLRDLRDLLLRKPPDVVLGVRIRPELLVGLTRSSDADDQALLRELTAQLPNNDVLVSTYRPTDVASYASADARSEFEAQLLRGESVLDGVNGAALTSRATWLTTEPINEASIDLLRTLGITNVLAIGQAAASFGNAINPNRPYAVRSANNGVVLHVADPRYSSLLDTPTGTAYESATAIAAEIIAQRNELVNSQVGAAVLSARHVVLASASGIPVEPLIASIVLRHLRNAPQISLRQVSGLTSSLEGLARVAPPNIATVNVLDIQTRTNDAVGKVEQIRDVLATNEGVADRWIELVDTANDTSLTDAQRAVYLDTVLAQTDSVRNAVRLPNTSFTFGSRDSELRLALTNTSAFAVSLRIRLTSPTGKMSFVPTEIDIVIPANGQQELSVAANARANGLIPVELVLASPTGTVLDVAQLRIRVNAIAGLGRGISGVFVLLLAAWWIVHVRRHIRKKNTEKHPVLRSQA